MNYKTKQNEQREAPKVTIPEEAIYYIVNQYLLYEQSNGEPVVRGLKPEKIEAILTMFLDWADKNGYVKENMLVFGGQKI